MATCTLTKPKTGTWSETFPKQQMTEQESLHFVKKLLAIAVSNITYLRVILPEAAFADRSVEGVNLKILKCDKSCPGVPLLVDWLKGAFDALEKKYLRVLILGIYTNKDDPNTMIETYTFKFSYSELTMMDIYKNSQKISSTDASNKTKQATVALLRTLIVLMGTLKPLPDNYLVTMKLLYYDKVTPVDYEPPGFKPADTDVFAFEDKPMKIRAGEVSTLFHALKMRVTTVSSNFKADITTEGDQEEQAEQEIVLEGLDADDEVEGNQLQAALENSDHGPQIDVPQDSQERDRETPQKNHNKSSALIVHETMDVEAVAQESASVLQKSKSSSRPKRDLVSPPVSSAAPQQHQSEVPVKRAVTPKTPRRDDQDSAEFGVQCPCRCNEDDGLMILCAKCGHWQHGLCFLIQKAEDAPEQHICNLCCDFDDPALQPTDQTLVGLSGEELQVTCLWRRALVACTEEKFVTVTGLSHRLGVEKAVVAKIMQRLEMEEFLKPNKGKSSKHGKPVNAEKLNKDGIEKYFNKALVANQTPLKTKPCSGGSPIQELQKSSAAKPKGQSEDTRKDIQTIVVGTSNLGISANKKSRKNSNSVPPSTELTSHDTPPREKATKVNRGKRLRQVGSDIYDFELSNTQEDYELGPLQAKRKKASTSARDLEP